MVFMQRQLGSGARISSFIGFCVKLTLQQHQNPPKHVKVWWTSVDRCRWRPNKCGVGVEGQEEVVEWSLRGQNSAVGCISVSTSDG